MKFKVLGCYGAEMPGFRTTSFQINDSILLDAGAVTSVLSHEEQAGIRDILVSHSHMDHIKDIPLLADNVIGNSFQPVNIVTTGEIIDILKEHLFNFKIWPDFSIIPTPENAVIRYREIEADRPFDLNGLTVKAVEVNHTVPTVGHIISDGDSSIAVSSDTCVTEKFWQAVNETGNVKAVLVETSFPNSMEELARVSGHLTPRMMGEEIKKIDDSNIPVYVYHLKPNFMEVLEKEIADIDRDNVSILQMDDTFNF